MAEIDVINSPDDRVPQQPPPRTEPAEATGSRPATEGPAVTAAQADDGAVLCNRWSTVIH
ncbi:hypothetical protein G3I40_32905 [Streptomyces sp. SID14478]|uniref:hypothetical protein n=1 Tax=Streptomyces sp. SID14478 TaxID=2706073 RepID=UPI0013DB7539|nr:hypothetical protein [Streptomyces sp. SID14478]NEB79985.1 hypothetical protein [Streptomyces sp. SID14478]